MTRKIACPIGVQPKILAHMAKVSKYIGLFLTK
jgi:hypothetical protein